MNNDLARDNTISDGAYRVLSILYSHTEGFEVSANGIAKELGRSRTTVLKYLGELEDARLLVIERCGEFVDAYHVKPSGERFREDEVARLQTPEPCTDSGQGGVQNLDRGVSNIWTGGCTDSGQGGVQNLYTEEDKEKTKLEHHAEGPPPSAAPRLTPVRTQAEELVQSVQRTNAVKKKLIKEVNAIIDEGVFGHAEIAAALKAWEAKPDAGPGLLPHLVQPLPLTPLQAAINQARQNGDMTSLRDLGFRWYAPDTPDGMRDPAKVRAWHREQKNAWLDEIEQRATKTA